MYKISYGDASYKYGVYLKKWYGWKQIFRSDNKEWCIEYIKNISSANYYNKKGELI